MQGRVTCHPELLTAANRRQRCHMCCDKTCSRTYQTNTYELCESTFVTASYNRASSIAACHNMFMLLPPSLLECFLSNLELPSDVNLETEFLTLEALLRNFLHAFEVLV